MKILKKDLISATEKKIINSEQANHLWTHFKSLRPDQPKFYSLHVLYYFGGILVLTSMSWFLTKIWSNGVAIMLLSFGFALLYLIIGNILWNKKLKIPAGLLITSAVALTPLFIYGLQKYTGVWSTNLSANYKEYNFFIREQWVYLEIGTIFTTFLALRFYKFAFLVFPLALSFWFLSMDINLLLFDKAKYSYEDIKITSCIFGVIAITLSYFADKKYKEVDFAFWGYLFGMIALCGSLYSLMADSPTGKFFYFMLSIAFIIISVYLRRRIFVLFGFIGVFGYLNFLSYSFFKDSYLFPVILAFIGLGIIFLGIIYKKNICKIDLMVNIWFPNFLLKWRPEKRD